jgi:hypothetical protein
MIGLLYDEPACRAGTSGAHSAPLLDNHAAARMADFSAWEQFGGWDHALPIAVDDLLSIWWRILSGEAPWINMVADDRRGSMRRVVAELVNEARDPDDDVRVRRLGVAAFEHGAFRAAQGCRRGDVVCEFGIVLDALDEALRRLGASPALTRDALAGLDPDLELAQRIAIRGWHRAVTKGTGVHALAVRRLLDDVR